MHVRHYFNRIGSGKFTLDSLEMRRINSKDYGVGFCSGKKETERRRKQRLKREGKDGNTKPRTLGIKMPNVRKSDRL